ncbi:MAG: nuclear transport factor 2 family protein, partial [Chitinophagales bacterium]
MKLTKKLEAEIVNAYNAIWDAYLKGDMRVFASMLDENCHIIGSAAGEIFSSKKSAVKYYKSTAEQITGKAEFRNRKISVMPVDKGVMVNEQSDFYVLIDNQWTFYGPARISSLFHKKNHKWKVIHQHGSFPDSKTEEGEQVNTEKIKAENLQLRDAVKRRTIELENKNRQLEIEAAVERVRAKALAMHKSEEIINVVNTLRNELGTLKIPGIGAATICLRQENGDIRLWDITSVVELEDGFHFSMDILFRLDETDPNDWIRRIWDADEKYFVVEQDKKSIQKTLAWTRKYNPEFAESARRFLTANDIKHVWHPAVPLLHGKLSLDLLQQPVAGVEPILTKMGAAFDLAYERFLDLKNAEAQAREAQIELALERVRTRAMTMRHSDELSEVLSVLFDQFDILGIYPSHATISLIDLEKNSFTFRMTGKAGKRIMAQQVISLDALNMWKNTAELLKNLGTISVYCNEYPKEVLPKLWELVSEVISAIPEDARPYPEDFPNGMYEAVGIYRLRGDTAYGTISFCHNRKATEEEKDIVGRFATEFGRLYQRFLDLQKAEAQAKESQIEAALERVRSKTMAMHKTDELQGVVRVVAEELKNTGVILDTGGAVICTYFQDSKDVIHWTATEDPAHPSVPYLLPYFKDELFDEAWASKNRGDDYFAKVFSYEVKNAFFNYAFEHSDYRQLPNEYKKIMLESKSHGLAWAWSKNSAIMIPSIQGDLPSEEEKEILIRFAKVFEQSFIRFLDLQKAEVQAREAQIELGLERVRARAMAMRNSDELGELVAILFEELIKLDLVLARCIIWIFDYDTLAARVWMANSEDRKIADSYYIKRLDHSYYDAIIKGWKEKNPKWVYDLSGEYKKSLDELLFNETELSGLPEAVKTGIRSSEHSVISGSFNNFGFIEASGPLAHSEEQFEILNRFGRVFDLSYTRFNDLKQAEAQAREAHIEASLERVRSKAMAMQKSEDLANAVAIVFQELDKLNLGMLRCGIGILNKENKSADVWTTTKSDNDTVVQVSGDESMDTHPLLQGAFDAWTTHSDFWYLLEGDDLARYYNTQRGDNFKLPESQLVLSPTQVQRQYYYVATFQAGGLFAFSDADFTDEVKQVMKRFANVFGLTYKRFLDLQKAEEQAREAKIEAALERVRSKAMSMQKSEDLANAVGIVFEELDKL